MVQLVLQNMHHTMNCLYNSNELLQFKTKEECVSILKELLNNSKKLDEYSKIFSTKTKNFYEEKKNLKKFLII